MYLAHGIESARFANCEYRQAIVTKIELIKTIASSINIIDKYESLKREVDLDCSDSDVVWPIIQNELFPYLEKSSLTEIVKQIKRAKEVSGFRPPREYLKQIDRLAKIIGRKRSDFLTDNEVVSLVEKSTEHTKRNHSECKPVDLRDSNSLFRTVRNQKSTGWCFAFSMADLYTHHYRNKYPNLGDLSFSPISVAIDYYFNDWVTSWAQPANNSVIKNEGGLPALTASRNLAGKLGLCLEDAVKTPYLFDEHIKKLESIMSIRQEMFSQDQINESQSEKLVEYIKQCTDIGTDLSAIFPNVTWSNLQKILMETERKYFIRDLNNYSCRNNRITMGPNFQYQFKSTSWPGDAIEKINLSLNNGNPVEFGYDAQYLDSGVDGSSELYRNSEYEKPHSSLIIGRRKNPYTNACQYLVRNSWGAQEFHESIDGDQTGGFFWIDEENIHRVMIDVSWLEE